MKSRRQIEGILAAVAAKGRSFRLLDKGDGYLLQVEYMEPDVETGQPMLQRGRKWYVSPWMTETEIVETAWAAYQRSVLHQAAEHFTYEGRRVYSPHFKVDGRIALCDAPVWADRRPDPKA